MRSKMNILSARLVRAAAGVAAVAMLAACGSSSTGPNNANVAGTYTLNTVNGATLPYTVPNTGTDVEIVQGATITITGDSTYAVNATGTLNGSPSTLVTDVGHYSVSGNQVTFTSTIISGANYSASVSGSGIGTTLTTSIGGAFVGSSDVSFTLVFTRSS